MNKIYFYIVGFLSLFSSYKPLAGADLSLAELQALFKRPAVIENFSLPDTNMVQVFDYYLKKPEFAGTVGDRKKYGLFKKYPDLNIAFHDYCNLIKNFIATYDPAVAAAPRHIAKIQIPEGAVVKFIGDLHGNIQALSRSLCKLIHEGFLDQYGRVTSPNHYIIFLGDFVDYGFYGADTLALAMKLRVQNPMNVFLCRGNHDENVSFDPTPSFNFGEELHARYGANALVLSDQIERAFHCLPLALFIAIEGRSDAGFIQCCHGGLGDDITAQIDALLRSEATFIGFEEALGRNVLWGDFTGTSLEHCGGSHDCQGRGKVFGIAGEQGLIAYMKRHNLQFIFRGHQDLCYSFKNLVAGVKNPVCVVPHALEDKKALAAVPSCTDWLARREINSIEDLNRQVFVLGEFPACFAPVITSSNASSAKLNFDEGYVTLNVAQSWQESCLSAYIFRPNIFKFYNCFYNPEEVDSSFLGRAAGALNTPKLVLSAAETVVAVPHYTYVDERGLPTIFLEKTTLDCFKKPDGISGAGICDDFKARFGVVDVDPEAAFDAEEFHSCDEDEGGIVVADDADDSDGEGIVVGSAQSAFNLMDGVGVVPASSKALVHPLVVPSFVPTTFSRMSLSGVRSRSMSDLATLEEGDGEDESVAAPRYAGMPARSSVADLSKLSGVGTTVLGKDGDEDEAQDYTAYGECPFDGDDDDGDDDQGTF